MCSIILDPLLDLLRSLLTKQALHLCDFCRPQSPNIFGLLLDLPRVVCVLHTSCVLYHDVWESYGTTVGYKILALVHEECEEAKKLQELNVVFHHPVDYCPDQLPLIREKLLQYLYQPREAYTHRLYYTESQDRTDQDDPYPHAFVRGGWSSDMHLKIGAVLFNEKLDTPSQQVVDVAVCEDFQDYRGDDQVRGFVQSWFIYLIYVNDGYKRHLEGDWSEDNVQF